MSERTDLVLNETVVQLGRIISALSKQGDSSGSLPDYDVYVMFTDTSYMGEKCLLGFNLGPDTATFDGGNISHDPHILKQTNIDPNFQFATSLPEELQSYWDGYGEYSDANFFLLFTEEEPWGTTPHGLDVSVVKYSFNFENDDEYGVDAYQAWGDSNFPGFDCEIVSKAEAEEFYNS